MEAAQSIPVDREARLAEILLTTDVRCAACGYNLRGLDPGGRCPECGTRVDRSVASPLIEELDGPWARVVSRGTVLVGAGLMAWAATALALGVAGAVLALIVAMDGFTGWRTPSLIVTSIGIIGAGAGILAVLAGVALATRPHAALDANLSFGLWRRGMRLAMAVWAGAIVFGGVVMLLLRGSVSDRALFVATDLYVPGVALGALAMIVVFVGYLGEVLTHVPDAGLARRCAWRARSLVLCVLVAIFGFLLANTVLVPIGRAAQAVAWSVAIAAGAGAMAMAAWLAMGIVGAGRRVGR